MPYIEVPSIRDENAERLEWLGRLEAADLFRGHASILARPMAQSEIEAILCNVAA